MKRATKRRNFALMPMLIPKLKMKKIRYGVTIAHANKTSSYSRDNIKFWWVLPM
jgi:hypothetical protein